MRGATPPSRPIAMLNPGKKPICYQFDHALKKKTVKSQGTE